MGKIPPEVVVEQLICMFEKCGAMYELRLMMDPQTGLHKGFCFITYIHKDHAKVAAETVSWGRVFAGYGVAVDIVRRN